MCVKNQSEEKKVFFNIRFSSCLVFVFLCVFVGECVCVNFVVWAKMLSISFMVKFKFSACSGVSLRVGVFGFKNVANHLQLLYENLLNFLERLLNVSAINKITQLKPLAAVESGGAASCVVQMLKTRRKSNDRRHSEIQICCVWVCVCSFCSSFRSLKLNVEIKFLSFRDFSCLSLSRLKKNQKFGSVCHLGGNYIH